MGLTRSVPSLVVSVGEQGSSGGISWAKLLQLLQLLGLAFGYSLDRSYARRLACLRVPPFLSVTAHSCFVTYQYS